MNFKRMRPVEILNDDGTTTMYSSMTKAAKAVGKNSNSYIYPLIALGRARFLDIETPVLNEKLMSTGNSKIAFYELQDIRAVEIPNNDGTTTTYSSMTKAAKALGKGSIFHIYFMVAIGKAKFVEPEEEEYYDALKPPKDNRPPKEFYKIISLMAKQHLRTL